MARTEHDTRPGTEVELEIGKVAHGGIFVARHEGRVVFVSDAITGEKVRARISDDKHDRFWRADPSRVRTIGGTGLGLSIALGDARLHGGTLSVWSELGRGSNFLLTLPRDGRPLGGSPLPLVPEDEQGGALEALGLTQPISLGRTGRTPS